MHRSDTPTRWSLASLLLILILILPVLNVHAAGAPTDAETPISPTPISPSSLPGIGYYYTVQPTDTLWDIAVAHGISVETLVAANTQVDPKRLQAGQDDLRPRAARRRAEEADAGRRLHPRRPARRSRRRPPRPLRKRGRHRRQPTHLCPSRRRLTHLRPSRRQPTRLRLSRRRSTQPPRPRPNRRRLSSRSSHRNPAAGRLRSWS